MARQENVCFCSELTNLLMQQLKAKPAGGDTFMFATLSKQAGQRNRYVCSAGSILCLANAWQAKGYVFDMHNLQAVCMTCSLASLLQMNLMHMGQY